MRKLYIALITIFFSFSMNAQVWINQGATWHYNVFSIADAGYQKIEYTNDTIIQGITCEVLRTERHRWAPQMNGTWIYIGPLSYPTNYTYMSNDTVYYWKNGQFEILYNFNAGVGDSWDLGVDTNFAMCSNSISNVSAAGTDTLNSQALDWIQIDMQQNSSVVQNGRAYKLFGSTNYLFPLDTHCNNYIVEWDWYSIRCYSDNVIGTINFGSVGCFSGVGIFEISNQSIAVFPNPAKDQFSFNTVGLNTDYTIELFDLIGKLAHTEKSNTKKEFKTIEVSHLNPGMYLLKVTDAENSYSAKVFIE